LFGDLLKDVYMHPRSKNTLTFDKGFGLSLNPPTLLSQAYYPLIGQMAQSFAIGQTLTACVGSQTAIRHTISEFQLRGCINVYTLIRIVTVAWFYCINSSQSPESKVTP